MVKEVIAKILRKVINKLPPPRIIMNHDYTQTPYLSRYYIMGAPKMDDGSFPYDEYGNPKIDARFSNQSFLGITGIYIHCFHRGDSDHELHNHPWKWALSFVLLNGYMEERRQKDDSVTKKFVKPLRFNYIDANSFHRVDLIDDEPAWTLFITGKKHKGWGFWDRNEKQFHHWREFLQNRREEMVN